MKHHTAYDPPKGKPTPVYDGYREIKDPKTGEITSVPLNPGLTRQEMSEECDINVIMKRYTRTGVSTVMSGTPMEGDFTGLADFQESLNLVNFANERFTALPAELRARFQNDPGKFAEFAANPANGPELVKLGLATKREEAKAPDTVPAPDKGEKAPPAKEGNKPEAR